jgi:hypothetical protein
MRRLLPSIGGLTVAALGFIVTFTARVKVDDAWWHLGVGQFMLSTHTLPTTNRFSFTAPDAPWLAHEWLSEVLFALVYRAGPSVLVLFATTLQVAAFAMVALLARGNGKTPGWSAALTFASSLLLIANFSIRPYLLGNLALLVTLWFANRDLPVHPERSRRAELFNSRAGRAVAIVALFILWANLHGSFIFGLGVLGLWALTDGTNRSQRFTELGVATGACLVTPHFLDGLLFPLLYLRTSLQRDQPNFLSNILEWQRVSPTSALGVVLLVMLAVAIAVILASRTRPTWAHVGLLAVFGFAAFAAVRNVALLGIALAVVLPRHLEALAVKSPSKLASLESSPLLPVLAWGIAALTLLGAPLATDFYPRDAVARLGPKDRVLNSFNWGGALLFAGVPVFIDQRNDCYPPEVLQDYLRAHRVETGWQDVLAKWRIDTVLWPSGGALADALRSSPGWQVSYEDGDAVIFRRTP